MAGAMSPSEVRSTVNELECSPSKTSAVSKPGGKPTLNVGGKSGATGKESGFHDGGVPGYASGKAPKAPQV